MPPRCRRARSGTGRGRAPAGRRCAAAAAGSSPSAPPISSTAPGPAAAQHPHVGGIQRARVHVHDARARPSSATRCAASSAVSRSRADDREPQAAARRRAGQQLRFGRAGSRRRRPPARPRPCPSRTSAAVVGCSANPASAPSGRTSTAFVQVEPTSRQTAALASSRVTGAEPNRPMPCRRPSAGLAAPNGTVVAPGARYGHVSRSYTTRSRHARTHAGPPAGAAARLPPRRAAVRAQADRHRHGGRRDRRRRIAEWAVRVRRLATALDALGVARRRTRRHVLLEHRVATWSSTCAAPCTGRVLHTLNIRLFPEQLVYIANHAEDEVVFVDRSLLPVLAPLGRQAADGAARRRDRRRRRRRDPRRRARLRGAARRRRAVRRARSRSTTRTPPPRCATPPAPPATRRAWSTSHRSAVLHSLISLIGDGAGAVGARRRAARGADVPRQRVGAALRLPAGRARAWCSPART